jgi:hypothetical protein
MATTRQVVDEICEALEFVSSLDLKQHEQRLLDNSMGRAFEWPVSASFYRTNGHALLDPHHSTSGCTESQHTTNHCLRRRRHAGGWNYGSRRP